MAASWLAIAVIGATSLLVCLALFVPRTIFIEYSRAKTAGRQLNLLTSKELLYVLGTKDQSVAFDRSSPSYLNFIRANIARPSGGPLTLNNPPKPGEVKLFSQFMNQTKIIDERLHGRRHGFFLECGAWDGEDMSNTLFFEIYRNWTGLLIEANPTRCRNQLLGKNRQAYAMCSCLSPTGRPTQLTYSQSAKNKIGGFVDHLLKSWQNIMNKSDDSVKTDVMCFPLNDILAALDVRHIDYFSLDIDGAELDILKSIDWSRVRIDTLSIESNDQNIAGIRQYMNSTKLYREVLLVHVDLIFERLDLNKH